MLAGLPLITYGSVCSGIESASVAWEPLGFAPVWLSEIEKFPSAVLAHHWPNVPNLGDMTALPALIRAGLVPAPEVLVGGTPCQAFSVSGKRRGLDDPRGQLTLTYVDILNAIDEQRGEGREAVCVWENVPGVLSSKDNAFGCFLGELSGAGCELKPAGEKWTNAGWVHGPARAVAWRVLDAQYFGVAQRRRRVFVVASARDGFDPGAVLFEFEGVRGDTAPSRETEAVASALTACGVGTCGADDKQAQARHIVAIDTRQDPQTYDNIAGPCTASVPPNGVFDITAFGQYGAGLTSSTCQARDGKGATDLITYPINDKGVRRLTEVECERLQGFADGHTRIPWRGKPARECPSGPRYKAIGNSKAVPVVRWVGKRLAELLQNHK